MNKLKALFGWFSAKRSRVILAALILFAGVFFIWTRRGKGDETQIQSVTVEKGNVVSTISASGTILTANTLSITTSATGIVKKVYVKDGDVVAKGQKLAEIDLDPAGAQRKASTYASYISATNSLTSAKNNLRSRFFHAFE